MAEEHQEMRFALRSSSSASSSGSAGDGDDVTGGANSANTSATPLRYSRASGSEQTVHSDVSDSSIDARNNNAASQADPRHEIPPSQGTIDRLISAVSRSRNPHRTRALVAVALSVVLVITGIQLIAPPLEQWQSNEAALRVQTQLARLENSVQSLSVDTVKVVQQVKKFLRQHQRVQISSCARTHLVARAGDQSYAAHARERFESHSFVMKEAIVYQSSQRLRINETRERLLSMNISVPVQKKKQQQQKKPSLPTKAQLTQLQRIQRQQKKLDSSIASLVVDTAKEAAVRSIVAQEEQQRSEAQFIIDSLRQLEQEIEAHKKRQASRSGGAFFFYAFVTCLTGGYLWTAAAERKRRPPQQRERPWSPIPTFMTQIKDLFKSVVVIEDLRNQETLLVDASDGEDDLGSLLVRTFAPSTPKMVRRRAAIPASSMRKL